MHHGGSLKRSGKLSTPGPLITGGLGNTMPWRTIVHTRHNGSPGASKLLMHAVMFATAHDSAHVTVDISGGGGVNNHNVRRS